MAPLGRILVVDDETPVREMLDEYFTTQGYTVETAASGNAALAAIERARPDLVLLDIRMPGIDGVETLRRIRDLDDDIAVIMVTANEDVALARQSVKMGAFDYVAKPIDFAYLDRAVAAGLLPSSRPAAPEAPTDPGDPWIELARAAFVAARAMAPAQRASTGARLEDAALAAAREAAAGRTSLATQHLAELGLLLTLAADLNDLARADLAQLEAALDSARCALPPAR